MTNEPARPSPSLIIAYCDYSYRGSPNTDPLLLAASIRRYGGACKSVPIWLMCRDIPDMSAQISKKAIALNVDLLPYKNDVNIVGFPLCAERDCGGRGRAPRGRGGCGTPLVRP
jgi:hypothetical protein